MTNGSEFDTLVLTPPGAPDATLAIAASRAGAVGVLNLEFADDPGAALAALTRLTTFGHGRMGVLLNGADEGLLSTVLDTPHAGVQVVILTGTPRARLAELVGRIHAGERRAYVTITNQAEARAAQLAGADALIAKGHEAGGWVGEETTFVLLQSLMARAELPIYAHGGIGLHTAAACYVAGAHGVVLDSQLLLARESALPDAVKARVRSMDGSDTVCLGASLGASFRVYARPDLGVVDELRRCETDLLLTDQSLEEKQLDWRAAVGRLVGWQHLDTSVLAVGQDAAFAAGLARRFHTVGGILAGLHAAVVEHCRSARETPPLAEGAALAHALGTRYPIVQGPMTRVSDRSAFALAVADNGALPFLALALMRAPEVRPLLEETKQRMADRPWGVGILGFVPVELRAEQLEAIRAYRPPYALIAGGRPDQARLLEADGIRTYLHVPSPGLLDMFLQEGSRRFVFEGRECGGHVGPRTSFVLWESMIDVLLDHLAAGVDASEIHVLFAGGVHDALSAAMVAALAGTLQQRGVRIGVLMGTAYLFTEEAVQAGAIVPEFQQAALTCKHTVLLETGPGHATRCVPSAYIDTFEQEKRRLLQGGLASGELRERLEEMNIGRLRVASKGVARHPRWGQEPESPKLITLNAEEQRAQGMYMIGQVAALRDKTCTLAELHHSIAAGSTQRLAALTLPEAEAAAVAPPPAAVAIVGMACILPGAPDLETFWANILGKVDAITEIPASRWDWRHYYDPDRSAHDKVYSRWGGFVGDVAFDPLTYGMPPNSLSSIEPFQLLALAVVRAALQDAGYLDRPFARERSSVILGAGGGGADLTAGYMVRSSLPQLFGESATGLTDELTGVLPEWTEDSFAGLLMNVAAGRVANRFDLGGVNYTVDAACASSLAAIYLAVRDLEAHTSDVVIVGGVDAIQNPFAYLCFSKTQALSPTGRCRPFDAQADGIAISEGFAAVVLKRLEDAERDGDRIYAVIRGVGGSSDGKDRSLTAPRPEGQVRALRRAYAQAGFSPATVGLVEAHGTGTVAGDQAEVQALSTFFTQAGASRQRCAIGSVKSMIGHTKATAGVSGLIKVALALHHRVLPPTLGVTQPNPKANFPASPFYVNSEPRPWLPGPADHPRRAGVSAFGFGGTNFHLVAESYTQAYLPDEGAALQPWAAELLVWRGASRAEIVSAIGGLLAKLEQGARPKLADLAYTLMLQAGEAGSGGPALAIVAQSIPDRIEKLHAVQGLLVGNVDNLHHPQGIHYAEQPLAREGKIAFLFPGQGSQSVNMARDLAMQFDEVRAAFERADAVLADHFDRPLSRYVFPIPAFTPDEEKEQQAQLTATNVAQPALGAAGLAYYTLLAALGVEPQMVAGHSYGEFIALWAGGSISEEVLFQLSEARGRFIREIASADPGTMAAVDAGPEALQVLLADPDLRLANLNAPRQTVISGPRASVERAVAWCGEHGLRAQLLPVACAFHSPLVEPAQQRLAALLQQVEMQSPRIPVYANTTGAVYPDDLAAIAKLLGEHLVRPVEFVREIEAMYQAGARVFVEVGPRNVLSGLVGRILENQRHVTVPLDQPGRAGLVQLLHGLAALVAEGCALRAARLYRGRAVRRLDLAKLEQETGEPVYTATTWLVNGGRARPVHRNGNVAEPPTLPLSVAIVNDGAAALPMTRNGRTEIVAPAHARFDSNEHSSVAAETRRDAHSPVMAERGNGAHMDKLSGGQVTRPAAATPGVAGVRGDATGGVMAQFQQVMQQFLQTQQAVMAAYLERRAGVGTGVALPATTGIEIRPHEPARLPVGPPADHNGDLADLAHANGHAATRHGPPAPVMPPDHLEAYSNGHAPERSVIPAAPARTETPAPVPAAANTAPRTRQQLTDQLLEIVKERTGYPIEMLGLDADMEADLGIDSIKRVEIAGTMIRLLELPAGASPDLEQLTGSRTLRQVAERLYALVEAPATAAQPGPATTGEDNRRPFDETVDDSRIGRLCLRPIVAPPISQVAGLAAGGIVVIVEDGTGVAEQLAARLEQRGQRTVRVAAGGAAEGEQRLAADLTSADGVGRLVARLHERAETVSALIYLAALRADAAGDGIDAERWRMQRERDLTGLFLLTQALQLDLERAATGGGAALLAATALGGAFASDPAARVFSPSDGGIVGFVKTVAQEWPGVRVKAVDIGLDAPDVTVERLLAELLADDGLVEVGYHDGQRTRLEVVPAPLSPNAADLRLDESSVVLITGGARGITAEVTMQLAQTYRPTLVLVGRTLLPAGPEPAHTAALTEAQDLKRAIMEQQRRAGLPTTIASVEQAYRELLREREVREKLAALQQTGARVHYLSCDVADTAAFGRLIDEVYGTHGRIDGVIHGAGIIEDKLVRDKQPASYERVLTTKVNGALVLASKLRPDALRFLVLFSSISSRMGNRGQADYAAASEILNKLAVYLDRRWPGRVVAMNWGPWLKAGMVSPEVQRQFEERGVALIPPEVGCRRMMEELRWGRNGEVEILIAGRRGAATAPTRAAKTATVASPARVSANNHHAAPVTGLPPLLTGRSRLTPLAGGGLEVLRTLHTGHDLYLNDHRLDGRPVMPFAVAIELMAETAAAASPGMTVAAVSNIRLLRGVTFDQDEQVVRVVAVPRTAQGQPDARRGVILDVTIASAEDAERLHYAAAVELAATVEPGSAAELPRRNEMEPHPEDAVPPPMSIVEAYDSWLFHGPLFQRIKSIEAMNPNGARALLWPSSPAACLDGSPGGEWLIDPVVVDCAFQMQLLWARHHWDVTLLPTGVQEYRRYGSLAVEVNGNGRHSAPFGSGQGWEGRTNSSTLGWRLTGGIGHEMRIRPESVAPLCHADHYFYGPDGRLLGVITNVQGVGSKALNRLAGNGQTR